MASQAINFLFGTGSTVVLARLLTPRDYGLIAMVTAITGFFGMFKNLGLSLATIQKPEINHAQVSNLFWLNVAMSFVFALILCGCAPIIAWFYGEPRLRWITLALAGTFVFSGLASQHRALLNRQMRFTAIALTDIGSASAGIAIAIVMALRGAGYWALVSMSVTWSLSSVVLVWVFCRWRPGLPARRAGITPMLRFGGHVTGFEVVNYFARNLDNILIGRFWGANVLGLYSRAYNIMMLPISQIRGPLNSVAIPAMSTMHNDPVRYKRYYLKLVTMIAFITMPIMVFLFVCADQAIYVLLGRQWLGVVDIFKVLCLNAFIQPVSTTWGLVLISLGQSKRYLTWGIINSTIIVASFVIGLPWGAMGVAIAYTSISYLLIGPTLWYCFKLTPISAGDFLSAILRPAIASLFAGLVLHAFRLYMSPVSEITSIECCIAIGLLTYLIALVLLPGGLPLLRGILSLKTLLLRNEA